MESDIPIVDTITTEGYAFNTLINGNNNDNNNNNNNNNTIHRRNSRLQFNMEMMRQLSLSFSEQQQQQQQNDSLDDEPSSVSPTGLLASPASSSSSSPFIRKCDDGIPQTSFETTPETSEFTKSSSNENLQSTETKLPRVALIRYFLDRPGYGLHNSAARLWFHPPSICTPYQIYQWLQMQEIALPGLLVEIYIDKWGSFMSIDAMQSGYMEYNMKNSTPTDPAIICVRLTDLDHIAKQQQEEDEIIELSRKHHHHHVGGGGSTVHNKETSSFPPIANTIPAGLFSFSMMVGLETAEVVSTLLPGSVQNSFVLSWGPYMFFVGGLLQIFVGLSQMIRNNLYGTIAFLGFGSFWLSNGLITILENHFTAEDTVSFTMLDEKDPWGRFIRIMFIFAFSCGLWVQTFAMNRLSTTLIGLLVIKLFFQSLTPWSLAAKWLQMITGWILSCFAFYVFFVEFTNQVYQKQIFNTYKWSENNSPEEVFGAVGRSGTLHSKAAQLRQARSIRVHRGALREAPSINNSLMDNNKNNNITNKE